MTRMKLLFGVLMLAVGIGAAPNAQAACAAGTGVAGVACLHYLAAGSSAMFQGFGVTVVDTIAPTIVGGGSIHHFTFKSANPPGELAGLLRDTRSGLMGTTIPDEPATIWIAFVCTSAPGAQCTAGTATDVWAYFQVDSTVGVRSILSRSSACPGGGTSCAAVRAELDANTKDGGSVFGTNVINPALFTSGAPSWGAGDTTCTGGATTCDDQSLPAEVYAALNNYPVIVGATDIRFEDAKYATKRATAPPSNKSGLGYGTVGSQLVGTSILSEFSHTTATPVEFGIPGLPDPITSTTVPQTLVSIPVGESPILVIANRTNTTTGLGALVSPGVPAFADVEDDNGARANRLSSLFSGNDCAADNTTFQDVAGTNSFTAAGLSGTPAPIHLIQREPLSGTYNTFEFTEIRTAGASDGNNSNGTWNNASACTITNVNTQGQGGSQECGVSGSGNNPLNLTCFSGGGTRQRAVGTGELVSEVKAGSTFGKDALGYTFFSFANVSSIGNSANYGYLTLDHVDPLFASYNGGDPGQPATGGALPGTLPTCTPGTNCDRNSVWTGGNYFPNITGGTYRSWSLLRQICDTSDNNCTADPVGASNIIADAASDIHNSTANSVADYVAVQDIAFIRAHYNLVQFSNTSHSVPFVHIVDNPFVLFDIPATGGELAGGPGAPGPAAIGGDAGGCMLPKNSHNNTVVSISAATFNSTTKNVKYNYTLVSGAGPSVGDIISVYGFGNGDDTPHTVAAGAQLGFTITSLNVGPPAQIVVHNTAGVTSTPGSPAVGVTGELNCMQ